jgi:hypothetical protein
MTTARFLRDYQLYQERDEPTSIGLRLEFWKKSLRFLADAPVIGHGSGSTEGLFEQASVGPRVLAHGQVVRNPHNQTLNVAIQWGALGVIVLYAMWLSHLLLFRGDGLMAWIGLMVVVQNFFTSLFNSHIFDFSEGWMYVLGVGSVKRRLERPMRTHDGWHASARSAISNPATGHAQYRL